MQSFPIIPPQAGESTVGTALQLYAGAKPGESASSNSVVKILYPETQDMSKGQFQTFLNRLPLRELFDKLALEGSGWSPEVAADLCARGYEARNYQRAYPNFIARFRDFCRDVNLLEAPLAIEIAPDWQAYLDHGARLLPPDIHAVDRLRQAGVTKFLGRYDIEAFDLIKANKLVQNIRSANRKLAKLMTTQGLSPIEFAQTFFTGERQTELPRVVGDYIKSAYCRNLWNAVRSAFPEMELSEWPDLRNYYSDPMDNWPESFRQGISEALFGRKKPSRRGRATLAPYTQKAYRQVLCSMVGIWKRTGIELNDLVWDLNPRDAVMLVFQGWPRQFAIEEGLPVDARSLIERLKEDKPFKASLILEMRKYAGRSSEWTLVESPFVRLLIEDRINNGTFRTLESMLDRVYTINTSYLEVLGTNLDWIRDRINEANEFIRDNETAYDAKKEQIFKTPHLFEQLMDRWHELFQKIDTLFPADSIHKHTFVRNLTYCALTTLHPLRIKNHVESRMQENYDPEQHVQEFQQKEVKNRKRIEFELPEEGRYAWVRSLVDRYLSESRPKLLMGSQSPYLYVADVRRQGKHGQMRRQAFNEILIVWSAKYLSDILPPGIDAMNPHLFRHVAATYQIVVHNSPARAAQLLGDKLEVIYAHYADLLASARSQCKEFYESC